MANVNPLLLVGAVIGVVTALLVLACALVKDKKETMGYERTMNDGEILRRLFAYAKPYWAKFLLVLFLMLFSIAYDIISPLIVGAIEELVAADFALSRLFASVAVYAGILVFSMASTYFQAVILQRVGQRIISDLREDLFTHIEFLSHEQLNEIPVGKLVTRVTNDTNAISMMFTNLLVNLTKNAFVILGILVAMLCLNYALTLMVLCFVPFIVIFTVIFRKFSRRAYRKVKDATTDINTYLSENLSGIKVTQIFGREDEKMAEFYQKSQTLSKVTQEQIFVFGVFRPLVYMLYISSILCLFYLGGMGHLNNVSFLGQTITGGTIVTFYMYISKFFTPIQNLAEQFNWLQSALASSEKVFSIMDIQPKLVDAPVLLVGDIDRGGVFAQLFGTVELLEPDERARIKGLIINKFRGDVGILRPGLAMLEEKTQLPVLGVVPYLKVDIEDEDSLSTRLDAGRTVHPLDAAILRLPHISNFTDFMPLEQHPLLGVRYVQNTRQLGTPDLIILPGTKNTVDDLLWLRQSGLEAALLKLAASGTPVLGVCGGYQMLGETLADPEGTESGRSQTVRGLGLLPIQTVFTDAKHRTQDTATVTAPQLAGAVLTGYQIHTGRTTVQGVPFCRLADGSAEGCVKDNVAGTYLHGLFDTGELTEKLVQLLCSRKGISPASAPLLSMACAGRWT